MLNLKNELLFTPGKYLDLKELSYEQFKSLYSNKYITYYTHEVVDDQLCIKGYKCDNQHHDSLLEFQELKNNTTNSIKFNIAFPPRYPLVPPRIELVTIPWHPNIRTTGEICMDAVSSAYEPHFTIAGIISSLRCLLEEPNLDDYVNEAAVQFYRQKMPKNLFLSSI